MMDKSPEICFPADGGAFSCFRHFLGVAMMKTRHKHHHKCPLEQIN